MKTYQVSSGPSFPMVWIWIAWLDCATKLIHSRFIHFGSFVCVVSLSIYAFILTYFVSMLLWLASFTVLWCTSNYERHLQDLFSGPNRVLCCHRTIFLWWRGGHLSKMTIIAFFILIGCTQVGIKAGSCAHGRWRGCAQECEGNLWGWTKQVACEWTVAALGCPALVHTVVETSSNTLRNRHLIQVHTFSRRIIW